MHVMPKQIAFAAVAAVLLAVVLFWQGAADGGGPAAAGDGRGERQCARKGGEGPGWRALREDPRYGEPGGSRRPAQSLLAWARETRRSGGRACESRAEGGICPKCAAARAARPSVYEGGGGSRDARLRA